MERESYDGDLGASGGCGDHERRDDADETGFFHDLDDLYNNPWATVMPERFNPHLLAGERYRVSPEFPAALMHPDDIPQQIDRWVEASDSASERNEKRDVGRMWLAEADQLRAHIEIYRRPYRLVCSLDHVRRRLDPSSDWGCITLRAGDADVPLEVPITAEEFERQVEHVLAVHQGYPNFYLGLREDWSSLEHTHFEIAVGDEGFVVLGLEELGWPDDLLDQLRYMDESRRWVAAVAGSFRKTWGMLRPHEKRQSRVRYVLDQELIRLGMAYRSHHSAPVLVAA